MTDDYKDFTAQVEKSKRGGAEETEGFGRSWGKVIVIRKRLTQLPDYQITQLPNSFASASSFTPCFKGFV